MMLSSIILFCFVLFLNFLSFCLVTFHRPNSHYPSSSDWNYLSVRLMDLCSRRLAWLQRKPTMWDVPPWLPKACQCLDPDRFVCTNGGWTDGCGGSFWIEIVFNNEDFCFGLFFWGAGVSVSLQYEICHKMSHQFINEGFPVLNIFLMESWFVPL